MRMNYRLSFLSVLACALSGTAVAKGEMSVFAGPYLGISIGSTLSYLNQSLSFDADKVDSVPLSYNTNNSSWGRGLLNGQIFLGYGQLMDRIYVGGELGIGLTQEKFNFISDDYSTNITKSNSYSALLHLGYLVTPSVLLYGIAGLTRADYRYDINFINGKRYNSGTMNLKNINNLTTDALLGRALGIGVSTAVSSNVKIRAEYQYINYNNNMNFNLDHSKYTFNNPIGIGSATLKNENILSVAMSYRFANM